MTSVFSRQNPYCQILSFIYLILDALFDQMIKLETNRACFNTNPIEKLSCGATGEALSNLIIFACFANIKT